LIPIRSEAVTRSSLGLDESAFVMTLIASLRPEKRVDVFCAAVSQAHRRCPRIRGLIVGNGPDLKRARQLAAQSGAVVQTLGERDDVPDIIAASDAICLSSSAEGFPMVMLEAMSIGRPLVATSVGGIPEAVEHGRTGLLVPPGDTGAFAEALVELAQRPDRAAVMGKAGRERYEALYGVEPMVAEYARLLRSLVCGGAGRGNRAGQ